MTDIDISPQDVKDFLDHHGVKGMHWGVRKGASRADRKWQDNIYSIKGAIDVHNAVADKMNNGGLDKLNNDPKFKGKTMNWDNPDAHTKAYFKAYEKMNEQFTRQAVKDVHGISPSGEYKARLDTSGGEWKVVVEATSAQHADVPLPTMVYEVEHDASNMFTLVKNVRDQMAQDDLDISVEDIEEYLEHFGVKGMKWGVRKRAASNVRSSSDARKTAKAKGKPIHALTNKQLRDATERLNLEQNFKKVNPGKVETGKKAALEVLATVGIAVSAYNLVKSPAGQAAIKTGKKFLKAS